MLWCSMLPFIWEFQSSSEHQCTSNGFQVDYILGNLFRWKLRQRGNHLNFKNNWMLLDTHSGLLYLIWYLRSDFSVFSINRSLQDDCKIGLLNSFLPQTQTHTTGPCEPKTKLSASDSPNKTGIGPYVGCLPQQLKH